jgi:hypothetical protein
MKKLKILLGNATLSYLAGSETWTYTLASQLKEMGHDVYCFSPELGIISEKLEEKNIKSFNKFNTGGIMPFTFVLEENFDHDYDFIIANHYFVVEKLRAKFPKTPIISTIHGIIHFMDNGEKAPEHPALESGVNQFIAVSEEVQEKLKQDYSIDSLIIRNFFNTKQYDLPKAKEKPKQFLMNTNYAGREDPAVKVVKEVAVAMGARLAVIGENFVQTFDTIQAIKDADVVFGMGRSVLEGVAAGRFGIVHGRWGTGGAVIDQNIDKLRRYNFSGRNTDRLATKEEIIEMIETYYNPTNLEWGKDYVARDHNVVFAAENFIKIGRELIGDDINVSDINNA